MSSAAPLVITSYGLIAAILWGGGDYLSAKATKRNSPSTALFFVSLIGSLIMTAFYLFDYGNVPWNLKGFLYSAAAGILLEMGLLVFFRGLDFGPVSLVSPISSAYPLVSLVLILFIFGGSLTALNIVGIIVVVSGIFIASGLINTKKAERKLSKGIIYALLTVLIWGLAYALVGKAVASIGWQKATLLNFLAGLAVLPLALSAIEGKKFWNQLSLGQITDKYILAAGIISALAGMVFYFGVSHTNSSAVITAISASYPILTIFLALKGLQEKAKLFSLFGALITISGIIILSL